MTVSTNGGKGVKFFIAILFAVLGNLCAQTDGFENDIPGALPQGWIDAYGWIKKNDICMISNKEAFRGKNAFLIDRREPRNKTSRSVWWKGSVSAQKRAAFSFVFKADGNGLNSCFFVVEIWTDKKNLSFSGEFKNGGIFLKGKSIPSNSFSTGRWYRVTIELPAENEQNGSLALDRWNGTAFEPAAKPVTFERYPSKGNYETFRLSFRNNHYFRLMLDDFSAQNSDKPDGKNI